MAAERVAMVFAHPIHLLVCLGMIQRYRPHVLFVTAADSAGDGAQEELARAALRRVGAVAAVTRLGMSELESYQYALRGEWHYYRRYRDALAKWLCAVRPDVVFGDAWEMYNFHHDVTRAMLDSALRFGVSCLPINREVPLTCRVGADLDDLVYHRFPNRPCDAFVPTAAELDRKMAVVKWAVQRDDIVAAAAARIDASREMFRAVPPDRDYGRTAPGLRCHFEEWGREQVRRGKYREALRFDAHFVPIAEALGVALALGRRAA